MTRQIDTPLKTNDQSFERVLATGLPCVFIFLNGAAPAPLLQAMNRLASEYAGDLLLAEIQMQENPVVTKRYQVRQNPSLVAFRKGQIFSRAEGISAADLDSHIAHLLGKAPKPANPPTSSPGAANRPTGSSQPLAITDRTFDLEVLRSTLPVLVDFWAPWCGPCRMTEPVLEKMAGEMAGRLQIAKVNVDENPLTAQRYGIQSIPTMLVFKGGIILDRWVGALPEAALRSKVAKYI